jgi:hypothetical protein
MELSMQRRFIDVFQDFCEKILKSQKAKKKTFWMPEQGSLWQDCSVTAGLKKLGIIEKVGSNRFEVRNIELLRKFQKNPPALKMVDWIRFYKNQPIVVDEKLPIGLENCLRLLDVEARANADPLSIYGKALHHIAHQVTVTGRKESH